MRKWPPLITSGALLLGLVLWYGRSVAIQDYFYLEYGKYRASNLSEYGVTGRLAVSIGAGSIFIGTDPYAASQLHFPLLDDPKDFPGRFFRPDRKQAREEWAMLYDSTAYPPQAPFLEFSMAWLIPICLLPFLIAVALGHRNRARHQSEWDCRVRGP